MRNEDVILSYKGFEPTWNVAHQVKSVTDILLGESPSQSCIKASFTRSEADTYQGVIRVNSSVGSFFATANDIDMQSLTEKLFLKIRSQLREWKTIRFLDPSPAELG